MFKIKTFYSFLIIIFGFVFVSFLKNESRSVQKDIKKLRSEIIILNQYYHEIGLDYQINSSPNNISYLANKYLELDFLPYEKKQIKTYSLDEKK